MWLSRFRNLIPGARCQRQWAPKPRRTRLLLERFEDRSLPSTFSAASVSDLIADINAANNAGGSNTIVLAANATFDVTAVNNTSDGANGLPVIAAKDNLTISGQGGDIIQRDPAAPAFRLFDVANHGSLTLANLTLQNGLAFGSGSSAEGGAIYNQGSLSLNGVTVQNNTAQGSNGVYSSKAKLANGQDAAGGGIWSNGTVTLANGTVVQSNQAVGGTAGSTYGSGGNAFGGGLEIAAGTANLTGVTVNNNSAHGGPGGWYNPGAAGGNGSGGALDVGGGSVTLTSDVFENNSALGGMGGGYICIGCGPYPGGGPGGSAFGGGLAVRGGSVTLTSDLLENNSATGGSAGYGPSNNSGGNGLGGGLYADGGATVTLCGDTVEFNTAAAGNSAYGAPPAQGEGGGIYIAPNTTVYLDAFTVANTINNTDDSGTNGSTANMDGSYILQTF
jgi:hypothetical protein